MHNILGNKSGFIDSRFVKTCDEQVKIYRKKWNSFFQQTMLLLNKIHKGSSPKPFYILEEHIYINKQGSSPKAIWLYITTMYGNK